MITQSTQKKPVHPRDLHSPLESGQAIVLIAIVMIGLIGMLGLAIDGGGLFFLQRDAQNATDATVLAASYAICTKGDPVTAGLTEMRKNGFIHNGGTVKITINHPPKSGAKVGHSNYVEVILNAHKPSYFIHLLYREPLQVTVYAVGNCYPPFDPRSVPGLWAGSTTCNDTVNWTGSSGNITGGLFSNNQIKFKGSNIIVGGGEVEAVGDIDDGGKVHYTPPVQPEEGVPQMSDPLMLDIGLYAPGGEVASIVPTGYYHAIPRLETTGWKANNLIWDPVNGTVLEGLYFIEGDVSVGNGVKVGPKGVTIVATGEIKFSGKPSDPSPTTPVKYYEGIMNPTAKGYQYPGLIFYANKIGEKCGNNAVSISEPDGYYKGIIYVPRSGVNVSGSSIRFIGTILAQTIDYSGSNGTLEYDPSLLPGRPPNIGMVE